MTRGRRTGYIGPGPRLVVLAESPSCTELCQPRGIWLTSMSTGRPDSPRPDFRERVRTHEVADATGFGGRGALGGTVAGTESPRTAYRCPKPPRNHRHGSSATTGAPRLTVWARGCRTGNVGPGRVGPKARACVSGWARGCLDGPRLIVINCAEPTTSRCPPGSQWEPAQTKSKTRSRQNGRVFAVQSRRRHMSETAVARWHIAATDPMSGLTVRELPGTTGKRR